MAAINRALWVLVLLCVLALAAGARPKPGPGRRCGQSDQCNSDMLLLVRQWGPTFCKMSGCDRDPYGHFTLHGLWPECSDGTYPANCGGSTCEQDIDITKLDLEQAILNQMNCEWPSYKRPTEDFWAYEYCKHGTCAPKSVFPRPEDFLKAVITLNDKFEVEAALLKADPPIDPQTAGSVDPRALQAAFKAAWGVEPMLKCSKDGMLNEVHLCLDLDLKAINCPNDVWRCAGGSLCSRDSDVDFPIDNEKELPNVCEPFFPHAGKAQGKLEGGTKDVPENEA